jgi:hypothetical protein
MSHHSLAVVDDEISKEVEATALGFRWNKQLLSLHQVEYEEIAESRLSIGTPPFAK